MDKPKRQTMMPNHQIAASRNLTLVASRRGSIDRRIRAFLSGESHGEDVLGVLYGQVADEPIPERLRALLKN